MLVYVFYFSAGWTGCFAGKTFLFFDIVLLYEKFKYIVIHSSKRHFSPALSILSSTLARVPASARESQKSRRITFPRRELEWPGRLVIVCGLPAIGMLLTFYFPGKQPFFSVSFLFFKIARQAIFRALYSKNYRLWKQLQNERWCVGYTS
jgi:hypothetical protein